MLPSDRNVKRLPLDAGYCVSEMRGAPMRMRAFIIDDMPLVAAAIELTLTNAGFLVTTAHDWREAQAVCTHTAFDVIVSDLQLPNLGDAQIIALLHEIVPLVPIVAMSGWSDARARDLAFRNGASAFVQKPARSERLLAAIDDAMGSPHERAALLR